jgi:hypothetical protein
VRKLGEGAAEIAILDRDAPEVRESGPAELRAISRAFNEMRERLKRNNIQFQEQNVESAGYQIFIIDPVGTRLEFNFPNSEAPDTIAPLIMEYLRAHPRQNWEEAEIKRETGVAKNRVRRLVRGVPGIDSHKLEKGVVCYDPPGPSPVSG